MNHKLWPSTVDGLHLVTVMLVTSDVGDFMMVTDLTFRRQNHYVSDYFRYVGDFFNV